MMSGPHTAIATPLASTATEPPQHTLRLRIKPKAPTTGFADGAWWPRSRDLSAELPALLAAPVFGPGAAERVSYNLTAWQPTGRRQTIDGHTVRLEGFRTQHPDTVTVTWQNRQRTTLVVVPPATDPATAEHTLATASQPGNTASPKALLAPGSG
jgi:hypothetical protein